MESRPTPYDLAFADLADDRFAPIRTALEESGQAPGNRDAFLMLREVVTLIRDLRPEEGVGEGIEQLAALVHHAYLFWTAGMPVITLAPDHLAGLMATPSTITPPNRPAGTTAAYVQLPEHRIWAAAVPGDAAEPLDGYFLHAAGDELRTLGVFGLRPDRMGFSVVEAAGERPAALARQDGSAIFAPTLPGGDAAGLYSLTGAEELLELGWRTWIA